MTETQTEQLISTFDATNLLDTFIDMAPFIIGIVGLIIGVNLVKWGVRTVRNNLATNDYISGKYTGEDEDIDYGVDPSGRYR